jgi:replicative DNA helicase
MSEVAMLRQPSEVALFNVDAEQQVLGAILCDNRVLDLVSDVLEAAHFFDPVHAKIFDVARKRILNGHIASPVSLRTAFEMDDGLAQLGGPAYLMRLAGAAIGSAAARDYANLIVGRAAARRLQEAAQEALQALSAGGEAPEVLARLQTALQSVPEAQGQESTYSFQRSMSEAVDQAAAMYQGETAHLKTGIEALDGIIGGLAPGDFCLIGGATSMGKTSVALEIAGNVAQDKGVCFVSLEMSRHDLVARMAAARSRVDYSQLRQAQDMTEDDFRKWIEGAKTLTGTKMRIVPKHVRDIGAIHGACRRAKRELGDAGLHLVIVDYAQLVRIPGKDIRERMTEVSIGLKTLASMLEVPVVALVQLSRDLHNRDDKRPRLDDIKESGQFENDADQVVFCHREAYYLERQGPKPDKSGHISDAATADWQADLNRCRNVMELIVRKNRHGRLATAQVGFHAPTNRFWKLDHQEVFE